MDFSSDYSIVVKARNEDNAKIIGVNKIREAYGVKMDFQVIEANPHIDMV